MPIVMEAGEVATGATKDHTFNNRIRRVGVLLSKFELGFGRVEPASPAPEGDDHHVKDVDATVTIVAQEEYSVTIRGDGAIVDSGGNSGGGTLAYLVIAELE